MNRLIKQIFSIFTIIGQAQNNVSFEIKLLLTYKSIRLIFLSDKFFFIEYNGTSTQRALYFNSNVAI